MAGSLARGLFVAVLASALLAAPVAGAARPAGENAAPIAAAVRNQLAAKGEAAAWVVLKARADLAPAYRIADWNARGQYVYDALTSTASRSQAGLLRYLAAQHIDAEPFWIMNAVRVAASAAQLDAIAARTEVAEIIATQTFEIPPTIPGSVEAAINAVEWGVANINADDVWTTYGTRGEGIVVATIDTGAQYNHPALVASYRGNLGGGAFDHNYNWWDPSLVCGSPMAVPCDNNGHGTHTMGTIAGDDGGSNQVGVAPGARWIAAKGCESSSCSDTALLGSAQFMTAPTNLAGANPRPDLRPNLVSNSWGGGGGNPWYQASVNAWVAAGMFPVFSNGNAGPACGTVGSPGDYVNAYGVGAYDINNAIAAFSSRGINGGSEIKPNISAPGVSVRSSYPGSTYASLSGTSMAAPHVAGVVALMLSAAPSLIGDIAATRGLLDDTAIDVSDLSCGGTADDNNVWGEGRIDALAAVEASPRGPTGVLSGTVRDAVTSSPLVGATVAVSGTSSRTTTTDGSGIYTLVLPVGTYDVTASKFAYLTGSASGVSVTQAVLTTQDLNLSPAPSRSVSGTVRDDGSPQLALAGATVSLAGTPIAPATTNSSGQYSFPAVPEGSYTALAAPPSRCLNALSRALTVGGANVTGFDFTLAAKQDAFGYRCRLEATSFVSGTSLLGLSGDDAVLNVALPFAFSYYGSSYGSANVSTNGLVSFTDASNSWTNAAIPSSGVPNTAVFAYWDDLYVDSPTAGIYTAVLGSAPNRQFVIEWRNVRFFGDASRRVSFEIILNEGGDIQTMYRDIAGGDSLESGGAASVGIENQAGSVGLQYSNNEAVLSTGLAVRYFLDGGGGGNVAPVATEDLGSTNEDTPVTIDVLSNDFDADGDSLAVDVASLTQPEHGTATIVAGGIRYTPDPNYNGPDLFTYRASDGSATSGATEVTLTVVSVNDAPTVAIALVGGATACAGTGGTVALAVGDDATSPAALAVTATSSSVKTGSVSTAWSGSAWTVTAPGNGSKVTATITVTVSDGAASSQLVVSFRAGGSGKETLNGGTGPDMLIGNGGNDTLRGNAGIDLLCGGGGNDSLTGGTQADFFSGGIGTDSNVDFNAGTGDLSDGT